MDFDKSSLTLALLGNPDTKTPRDVVFKEVLGLFNEEPIKICQVGAIESFDPAYLLGSGWSDRHFGPYVKKFGGEYHILDIDLDHLANSLLLAQILGYKVDLNFSRGEEGVKPGFDLYYLDGSNEPSEMLVEIDNIRNESCVILCDDWSIKGTLVRSLFDWKVFPVSNGMAMVDLRKTPASPV